MVVPSRCTWCEGDELYIAYHDDEWGVPVFTAQELFERLILEGMQAGLSWLTILRKRARMQEQFFNFDISRLANAGEPEVQNWLSDPGIIRHRGKLQAMVSNARLTLDCQEDHPDFSTWLWSFAPNRDPAYERINQVPSETAESQAMSKALKKNGYKFVGPTICYAFMQSVGMVNDHATSCLRYSDCANLSRTPAG
jgi:DNA-3-methyladenine glycosylase I